MQTIAANLGSMLTPIGNPQNLYLYGKSGMSMAEFLLLMFPYTVVSLLLLVGWAVAVCRKQASASIGIFPEQQNITADRKIILLCWSVPSALTAPLSAMWITPCC